MVGVGVASKVARDASCAGSVKAIEIPPPRPKRKPIRPYPRKQAPCSSKELPVLKPFGRSSSPVPSASEQENRSPTSVLSAIGFETMNPFLSNKPKKSTSPSASAAGSNEPGIGIQSSAMSVLSLGLPGQKTEGSSQTVHKLELEQFNLLPEPALDTNSFFQERSHSSTQTLKLFGATVQVTGDRTSPLPLEGATRQCQGLDFEEGSKAGFAMGAWPSSGLLPMFFCLPSPTNSALPAAEAGIVPTPCWTLYGNAPFPYAVPQQNSTSKEKFNQSCVQNECSGTGSNTSYEGGNVFNYQQGDRCSDEKESAAPMALKLWQNMTADSNSGRGFVPYKRCVVEERVEHPERTGDQARDRRTARLCL
ncbi:hypothetical protein AXF42_Ash007696 [Apostasia shenzhenica]|uniref:Uncharacterized protein n=1 Tax=Apostasia shenzhenica TaxID=1088818 RepID=A0A2I0A666_9ASPA|nr:hypothetical protein AXF42_Ash007696 [Apostasia shenzhenica]